MTTHRSIKARTTRRPRRQKGVALLLVLVAMASATILAGSFLVSRRNSSAIGANVLRSAQARWASQSAAEFALAALQTDTNWFDANPTEFIRTMVFGDATVRVYVTNIAGQTPTPFDSDLVITAMANVNGVVAQAQKLVQYKSGYATNQAYDPLLGEFAVYALQSASIDSASSLYQWPGSPNFHAGRPVKVGGAFTDAMSTSFDPAAQLMSASLFVRSDASLSLKGLVGQAPFEAGGTTPDVMPVPPAALPASFSILPYQMVGDLSVPAGTKLSPLASGVYFGLKELGKDAEVTIDGANGMNYQFSDIDLNNQSILKVKGDVRIYVQNDVRIRGQSVIEVDKNANAVFYVGGDITIEDSAVGFKRDVARNGNRTVDTVIGAYQPASQVHVMGLRRDLANGGPANYLLDAASLARMVVHAPMADVQLQGGSAVFGRVTSNSMNMQSSSLVYDTALDQGVGVTEPLGPLYDQSGNLIADLYAVLSLFDPTTGSVEDLQATLDGSATLASFPPETVSTTTTATTRDARRAVARPWPVESLHFEETATSVSNPLPWTDGTQTLVDAYITETLASPTMTTVAPRSTTTTMTTTTLTTTSTTTSDPTLVDKMMQVLLAPVQ